MHAGPPSQLRVALVSPASAAANNGNWQTASRWQRMLAPVAVVDVCTDWPGDGRSDADVMIALHARRSAGSIERYAALRPGAPIGLVLTGTDLYRDLDHDPRALHSVECARIVVVLQEAGLARLDATSRARARVIVQSAPALVGTVRGADDADFIAVGHLRSEKDPETLMRAAGLLAAEPATAALRVVQIGMPLEPALADAARATQASCPGYRWLGPLPHGAARRAIAQARALVHPSRIEGGANVVIEAVRSHVPVLASRIDGNVGLLGQDYDGYFAQGDASALAALMRRFAGDAAFAGHLAGQCALREPLFRPAAERGAVRALLRDLVATL